MELNDFIGKADQFTPERQMVGIPHVDRTAQVDFGMDMARRAAQQSQQPPEMPKAMPPIVPLAN